MLWTSPIICAFEKPIVAPSDGKGEVRLTGLEPGTYTVQVFGGAQEVPMKVGPDGTLAFVNGPDMRILDSSFNERDELTASHTMDLFVHPDDAAAVDAAYEAARRGDAPFRTEHRVRLPGIAPLADRRVAAAAEGQRDWRWGGRVGRRQIGVVPDGSVEAGFRHRRPSFGAALAKEHRHHDRRTVQGRQRRFELPHLAGAGGEPQGL